MTLRKALACAALAALWLAMVGVSISIYASWFR